MEEQIKNDLINIIKTDTHKDHQEAELIYKNLENNLKEDLNIITNSTNKDLWLSYLLYKKNNFNLINSLTEFEDPNFFKEKKSIKVKDNYSEIEKKIIELRHIADTKDEYYELIVKKK